MRNRSTKAVATGLVLIGATCVYSSSGIEQRDLSQQCEVYTLEDEIDHDATLAGVATVKFFRPDSERNIQLSGRVFSFLDGYVVRVDSSSTLLTEMTSQTDDIVAVVKSLEIGKVGLSQQCIFTENHGYSVYSVYLEVPVTNTE